MHTMCLASFPRGQLCARFGHGTGHIKTRPIRTRSANPKIEKCSHTRQGHLHWIAQAFPLDFFLGFRRSFKPLLKVLLACFVHSNIHDVSEIKAYTLLRSSTETLVGNQVGDTNVFLLYTGWTQGRTEGTPRRPAGWRPGLILASDPSPFADTPQWPPPPASWRSRRASSPEFTKHTTG